MPPSLTFLDFSSKIKSFSKESIDSIMTQRYGEKWSNYRLNWNRASSMEKETDFPLFVLFETQYTCNLKCKMCIFGKPEMKKKYEYSGKLSIKTFKRIIDECVKYNCPSICMNNINEPLLDKDIYKKIKIASEKGIVDIQMNTNATIMDEESSRNILKSGLTRLLIGFDGFGKEEYEKIRIGANYDTVMSNVTKFLKLKKQMRAKLPLVRISLVHMEENDKNVEEFLEYWIPKVDYVSIQRMLDINKEIDDGEIKDKNNICTSPWERLVVQGDGTVLPCCCHFAKPLAVGNIHESSLYEIWNSDEMKLLRQKHKEHDYSDLPVCRRCLNARNK